MFEPGVLVFTYDEISTAKTVNVSTANAGDISYGMTARSSANWCHVSVTGGTFTVTVDPHYGTSSARVAYVYVTYLNSEGEFLVKQGSEGPMTVTIGGLEWCEYNLADPFSQYDESKIGSFATLKPSECPDGIREESHGKFYQWNNSTAWSYMDDYTGWLRTLKAVDWEIINNPCPQGFRIPTNQEWTNLINNCTISYSNVFSAENYGYVILLSKTSNTVLEFPAAGRLNANGPSNLNYPGQEGRYWTSIMYNTTSQQPYFLKFNKNTISVEYSDNNTTRCANNIRCVRDIE